MKTIQINLYEFSELNEDVQKKVLENLRHINIEYGTDWSGCVEENFKDEMRTFGIDITKIYYSGFGSPRDGACFECDVDIEKFIKSEGRETDFKSIIDNKDILTLSTKHGKGRYYHENSMNVLLDEHAYDRISPLAGEDFQKFEDVAIYCLRDYAKKLYRELEKEYYEQISDASVIAAIEGCEYTFEENGTLRNE